MNWKSFLFGFGIGLIGTMGARELYERNKFVSSEKALAIAKNAFKKTGPISGSWIQMEPEDYEIPPLTYKVYKGGITRSANGKTELYEFIADARSGALLKTSKI